MTAHLVILRPEPGATATLQAAYEAGWEARSHPLFRIAALGWTPPTADRFEAVLMTSANAVLHGGPQLALYTALPLYAVGAATAKAAKAAGFESVEAGGGDGDAIAELLRRDGRRDVVHFSGADVRRFDESGLSITRIPVYAAEPSEPAGLVAALAGEPVVLLHSPGAGQRFALWCKAQGVARSGIAIVAISANVLAEAGGGWRAAMVAAEPSDAAMLAAAELVS